MRINQNISAMNTYSRLTSANTAKSGSLAKLSSGLRINKAGDDAAGLAISEKMRGQVGGLKQAVRNAQDGISLIQTAEGALNETHSILNRMRDLAVQASNDTNTNADRVEIQKEMDQLATEISRIADTTEFNTQNLLGGDFKAKFHIGANQGQNMELEIADMGANKLGVEGKISAAIATGIDGATVRSRTGDDLTVTIEANVGEKFGVTDRGDGTLTINLATDSDGNITTTNDELLRALEAEGLIVEKDATDYVDGATPVADSLVEIEITYAADANAAKAYGINVSSQTAADAAITTIDNAISNVSSERSKLGSVQNRLEHTINNLTATSENLSAAESRIRDVDMAEEMMEFTKNNILSQAATAMLAQANQMPNSVLQLLQ
jgi:flagellin